jgi:hypothetical protein
MTIELSLRRRATQSRCLALLWLSLAIIILVGTYISIPSIASKALVSVSASLHTNISGPTSPVEMQAFYCAMGMIVFGLSAIAFACFLLGRSAFIELEVAARSNGLADALCISDGSLESLEKAANLLVPKGKYFAIPDILSRKDRESFIEIVKLLRKGV